MGLLILVIGILIGAYLVVFSLNNTQQVQLDMFGFYLQDVYVWEIVLVCFVSGLVLAILVTLPAQWRASRSAKAYKEELSHIQAILEEERRRRTVPAAQPTQETPMEEPAEEEPEEETS